MAGDSRRQRAKEDGAPKITIKAGDALEYRVMRLFIRQGYFVRRSVEIYTESYLNQATDLDVMAAKFVAPFRLYRQIVECKSGGGERPLDRIFWLSGVRHHVHADIATLVRPNTKWDIKAFARENGVELLDIDAFEALEARLGIEADFWPGVSDRKYIADNADRLTKALAGDSEAVSLYLILAGEAQWRREIPSINYLLFSMRRLTRALGEKNGDVWRHLLADSLGHFFMFMLSFVAKTLEMRDHDVRGLIYKELKYGSTDKRVVDRTMRLALRISEHAVEELGVSSKRLNSKLFDYPEPQNSDDLFEIYRTILNASVIADALPAFVDFVTWERFVYGRDGAAWLPKVFPAIHAELGELAAKVCAILERVGALPGGFTEVFSEKAAPGTHTVAAPPVSGHPEAPTTPSPPETPPARTSDEQASLFTAGANGAAPLKGATSDESDVAKK